jgi:chitodextrinase
VFWKKDHVYAGPGGREIAIITPPPTDQTAPSAPSGLTSSNITATSVQLSWSASTDTGGSGLAGYKVYRQMGSGASLPVGTVGTSTLSFVDKPLKPNQAYAYVIRSYDVAQNHSAASNTVSITTLTAAGDTTAPDVPANLRGRPLTGSPSYKVRLDWNAVTDVGGSGVAGYEVYRNNVLISGSVIALFYEDTTNTANTAFTYKIKAADGAGNRSAFSATVTVTTLP